MAYVRQVKTGSGATAVQIVTKSGGKIVKVEHLGSGHNQEEIKALMSLAHKRLHLHQTLLFPEEKLSSSLRLTLKHSYSVLLWQVLCTCYKTLGFGELNDPVFMALAVARLVTPTSKIDSLRVLLEIGAPLYKKHELYSSLSRVIAKDYRSTVSRLCVAYGKVQGLSLVLYDVTTLYFEVQKEDEYRQPGMSKERRLEPQIIVGLLVNQQGFPLGLHSFPGRTAETTTIVPVLTDFCQKHGVKDLTVVADAAMLSQKNLEKLTEAGYHYIVGSRLYKIPYEIEEYRKTKELGDCEIVTSEKDGYHIHYQYKEKRATLDLFNLEKQIEKAKRVINGQTKVSRAKYVTVQTKKKQLNQKLIDKAKSLAGIKGYVTNLDAPATAVITYYHQLFQVEKSFRMAKSDLKARPIFHHKKDSIEAHLTLVLVAIAIGRYIEEKTQVSLKRFIQLLLPIRSGTVTINNHDYEATADIPPFINTLLQKLPLGH